MKGDEKYYNVQKGAKNYEKLPSKTSPSYAPKIHKIHLDHLKKYSFLLFLLPLKKIFDIVVQLLKFSLNK